MITGHDSGVPEYMAEQDSGTSELGTGHDSAVLQDRAEHDSEHDSSVALFEIGHDLL